MSLRKLIKHTVLILISLLPLIYLWLTWQSTPESGNPLHFDISGNPDRLGTNKELLWATVFLCIVNIGVYLLMINIHKIDPKRAKAGKSRVFETVGTGTLIFITALNFLMILNGQQPEAGLWAKLSPVLLGLLFTFLGNIMYNIKPNYFAGIRIPWTLNDEENWKKTHRLAGIVWFIGGIILTMVALIASQTAIEITQRIVLVVIIAIPVVYSFLFFIRKRQLEKQQ